MNLIPAIDLIDGKCVRLTQGDYARKKVYSEDPLEVARTIEEAGLRHLHLVDLDGARARRIVNWKVLERIAAHTGLWIDFGGGMKSDDDLRIALECGARQITGGTVAVKAPHLFLRWLDAYGPETIILGADARRGKIALSGWQEESELDLMDFLADYWAKGVQHVISTDIGKDGKLEGPALAMYRAIREHLPELKLIASGGITTRDDLDELRTIGCHGAIIGKALYEGRLSLPELGRWQREMA
jgi:phosphoribosylformimino-5-aminoimidazole carboxamide ribotide isomerase